nr:O-antigen ligase family protein [Serratia fonticola]
MKASRNNLIIFNICFFSLVFSISIDLFVKGYPEKIFYLVSYIAVVYTVVQVYKNRAIIYTNRPLLLLFISLILYGLSKIIWATMFKNTEFIDIRDNYRTVGKRFILSAFVLFYFYQCRELLNKKVLGLSIVVLFVGLCISLWVGYLSRTPVEPRVKWTADAATTGSYLVVLIAMTTIILIRRYFGASKLSLLLFLVILLINMVMISMTETRSAIFLTPVLYLVFFMFYHNSVNRRLKALLAIIILSSAAVVLYCTWDRVAQIKSDISEYSTNNNTSIGARFSIWKSGWYSVTDNFWGQNTDQRYQKVEEYIHQYERANPEAARNVIYHLHNDILETLSLQGIFGLFSLLCFYIFGLYFSLNKKNAFSNCSTLFVIFPVMVFGITDVVLIQSNTALVIIISLVLSIPLLKRAD